MKTACVHSNVVFGGTVKQSQKLV